MAIIRKIQWLISSGVLIYGVALLGEMGLTALVFVGIGLGYCALVAWASRLTIFPLFVAWIADCLLALMSWRLLMGSLEGVPLNAAFQQRAVGYGDYLTLDGMAAFVILVLVALYLGAVILKWRELTKRPWW